MCNATKIKKNPLDSVQVTICNLCFTKVPALMPISIKSIIDQKCSLSGLSLETILLQTHRSCSTSQRLLRLSKGEKSGRRKTLPRSGPELCRAQIRKLRPILLSGKWKQLFFFSLVKNFFYLSLSVFGENQGKHEKDLKCERQRLTCKSEKVNGDIGW